MRRHEKGRSFFRRNIRNDDETLLVLQREEESRLVMLGEVANSYTFEDQSAEPLSLAN